MWYRGRDLLISKLFICNCPEQHEPSQAVWHSLTLSMIKRFCPDYPAMRGAFNLVQHRQCLTVTLFTFSFLGKGKPKCFHVSDLKICCSIRTFTNFTAPLSLAIPGVHHFRSTTCLSGHYGHARADGKMYFPLHSTLHYVFCSKYLLFEIIMCPAWYQDIFHTAIWPYDSVTSPVNRYNHH